MRGLVIALGLLCLLVFSTPSLAEQEKDAQLQAAGKQIEEDCK